MFTLDQDQKNKYDLFRRIIKDTVLGRILPQHDETGHKYLFVNSGITVSSVTTKLILDRPHLIPWAIKVAFEYMEDKWTNLSPGTRDRLLLDAQQAPVDIRDEAGEIGHLGHDIIEKYCLDYIQAVEDEIVAQPLYPMPQFGIRSYIPATADGRVFAVARSAEEAFRKFKCIPLATELLVGDENVAAGTLDMLVMTEDGYIELWDWKTSNGVHDTYAYQVAAYKAFFEKMTGLKISRTRIVHLSKEFANPVMYYVPDVDKCWRVFELLSEVHDIVTDGEAKLEPDVNKIIFDVYDDTTKDSGDSGANQTVPGP